MAHLQQMSFCESVKAKLPDFFSNNIVIDIGSLDINGNNQYLFKDCLYIGVDIKPGKNVDIISKGHELNLPDESVDVVISTECFEHDRFYVETLRNIYRILKPGGLFLFTCATKNRPEHGTRRTTPEDAPFLASYGEWGDYYKNLDESDIRLALDVEKLFATFEFSINNETNDLYFWGIKCGLRIPRHNYSFLMRISKSDKQIASLNEAVSKRDEQIASLNQEVSKRDEQIASLNQAVAKRDMRIISLNQALDERDVHITNLNQTLDERNIQISNLSQTLDERNVKINSLNQAVGERDIQINGILASRSWLLTKPLRWIGRILRGEFNMAMDPFNKLIIKPIKSWGELFKKRIYLFTRYLYHRIPLPIRVKWRIREIIFKLLNLSLNEIRGQSFEGISRQLEGAIRRPPNWNTNDDYLLLQLVQDLSTHCTTYGSVGHMIALPFLSTGGAELVALNFARAIREIEPDKSVVILVTDKDTVSYRAKLPLGVKLVVLDRCLGSDSSYQRKQAFVKNLLLALRPDVFHNINSEVAWRLILEEGSHLQKLTKIFASIFAFQFSSDGKKIGYAAYFLQPGLPYLSGLLSDNRRFLNDAIREYSLDKASRVKLRVTYNPCRILDEATVSRSKDFLSKFTKRSTKRRLRVLWAGRLDAEKRVDLLLDIVKNYPSADFFIFGQCVVDKEKVLPKLPNLIYRGPFLSPCELVTDIDFDAFIFTSWWEGMPNIIVEVGVLGIPVVAPTVGGIGELICENTGYPLPERPNVADYVSALLKIAANPENAARRAEALLKLIENRHEWNVFVKSVKEIPSYFITVDRAKEEDLE